MDKILIFLIVGIILSTILLGINFRYYLFTLIDSRRNFKDYRKDKLIDLIRFEYLGYILPYVIGNNEKDDPQTKDLIDYHNFWARYFWVSISSAILLTIIIAHK